MATESKERVIVGVNRFQNEEPPPEGLLRIDPTVGERQKARDSYQFVLDVWRHADPELEPYVREARAGLERLAAER